MAAVLVKRAAPLLRQQLLRTIMCSAVAAKEAEYSFFSHIPKAPADPVLGAQLGMIHHVPRLSAGTSTHLPSVYVRLQVLQKGSSPI